MALPACQAALSSFNVLFTCVEKIDAKVRNMQELQPLAKEAKEECEATRKKIEALQVHFGPDHPSSIAVHDAFQRLRNADRESKEVNTLLETKSRIFLRATSLKAKLVDMLSDLRNFSTALYTLFLRVEHRKPLAVLVNDALVV